MAQSFSHKKRSPLRGLPTVFLVGLSVIVAASCVADNDEPLASSDPGLFTPAVAPQTGSAPVRELVSAQVLRQAFPEHFERVVGRIQTQGFVAAERAS